MRGFYASAEFFSRYIVAEMYVNEKRCVTVH